MMFSWWRSVSKLRLRLLLGLILIMLSQVVLAKMPLDLINNNKEEIEEFADISFAVPWYETLPELTPHKLFLISIHFLDSIGSIREEGFLYGEVSSFVNTL